MNLAFYLLNLVANPAIVPPPTNVQVVVEPIKAPSIPVETKDGAKAWFHPAPGAVDENQ